MACWNGRTVPAAAAKMTGGGLRFAYCGRVSTEDYQDPVTSRARQLGQAEALVAGHGQIVAHFSGSGLSAAVPLPGRVLRDNHWRDNGLHAHSDALSSARE